MGRRKIKSEYEQNHHLDSTGIGVILSFSLFDDNKHMPLVTLSKIKILFSNLLLIRANNQYQVIADIHPIITLIPSSLLLF